jgi:hypothetical protein
MLYHGHINLDAQSSAGGTEVGRGSGMKSGGEGEGGEGKGDGGMGWVGRKRRREVSWEGRGSRGRKGERKARREQQGESDEDRGKG